MTRFPRVWSLRLSVCLSLGVFACGGESPEPARTGVPASANDAAQPKAAPPPASVADERPRVVVLGDSLTEGLGLLAEEAFPALLQRRIDAEGLRYAVRNAGKSGDTSAGGLSRLELALEGDVRLLVVALGGNDALRGLPVDALERNLSMIIERAQQRDIRVVLAGMEAPPNFGESYIVSFRKVYANLAQRYMVALVPFLLQDVAGIESLNQRDGIHPTAEGSRQVADNVWSVLRPLLKDR